MTEAKSINNIDTTNKPQKVTPEQAAANRTFLRNLSRELKAARMKMDKGWVGCRIGVNGGPIFAGEHDPEDD